MPFNGFKSIFIKIIAAITSAIVFSLYVSWKSYTPASERLPDVGYYSFSTIFAFGFVPNFFIFIILGVILSPIMDRIVFQKFNMKGIRGILILVLAYLLLGVITGVIISAFFLSVHLLTYYINASILSAMIFLFVQTVLQFVFYKLAK